MKKIFVGILALALIVGVAWAVLIQKSVPVSEKPTVKIGVTLPLSGDMAWAGVPVRKAIELSLQDIKKNKNLKYDYKLIFEDDQLKSQKSLLNYQRLKSLNHVNAVMSMWGDALPISLQTTQDKIIHIGCAWGYDLGKGYYNLNNLSFPSDLTGVMINQLKKKNIKRIGIINNTTKGEMELLATLEPELAQAHINVAFRNTYPTGTTDFRISILKMKESKVDAVLTNLNSPSLDIYMKQANELGYNPKYVSFTICALYPHLFEGQWCVVDGSGTPEFITYYEQETGEKIGSCVANEYDSLQVLVHGFEWVGDGKMIPDNKDVVKHILEMKNFGRALPESYIDEEGNIHTTPVIMTIKNGRAVITEE